MRLSSRLALLLLSTCYLFFFYGDILVAPNDYMFSADGDGLKNYFTYAYQIKHGESIVNFEGMNYPFGEHFFYTDCHPALVVVLQPLATVFPSVADYSVGILNMLLLLSVWLSFLVYYALLRRFGVRQWVAVFFTLGMVMLSPQIFRITGHFALSYSIAIPLAWLLADRLFKAPKPVISLALLLSNALWIFVHAYLGIIVLAFLFAFLLVKLLWRKAAVEKRSAFILALSIALPVFLYLGIVKSTDSHEGRTDNPSGFFLYNAEPDDILLPHHPPLRPLLDSWTNNAIKLKWEAWSYVGFASVLVLLVLLIAVIRSLILKRKSEMVQMAFSSRSLNQALLASFIVLLFAMAIPFKSFPSLVDALPVLKQFRATGRFTWPFYAVFLVFTSRFVGGMAQQFESKEKKVLALALILFFGLMNVWEGYAPQKEVADKMTSQKNLFVKENLAEDLFCAIEAVDAQSYQAMLAIPFFHVGSESFSRPRDEPTMQKAFVMSYHLGLPLMNANLTRVAIPEAKMLVQAVGTNGYPQELRQHLVDERPILLMCHLKRMGEGHESIYMNFGSQELCNDLVIGHISPNDLTAELTIGMDFREATSLTSFYPHPSGFEASDSLAMIWVENFDNLSAPKARRGKGAFAGMKAGRNVLKDFPPNTFVTQGEYDFSIWMHNGVPDALNLWFRLIVEEYDPEKDEWFTTTFFPEHAQTIDGDWSLVKGSFTVKDASHAIRIMTIGKENSKATLIVDELMVYEKGTALRKFGDGQVQLGNHVFLTKDSIVR